MEDSENCSLVFSAELCTAIVHSYKHTATSLWNSLPQSVRFCESLNNFPETP